MSYIYASPNILSYNSFSQLPLRIRCTITQICVFSTIHLCIFLLGNTAAALEVIKRGEIFPAGRLVDRIDAARQSQMQQQQQQQFYHQNLMQNSQFQQHHSHTIMPPQQRQFSAAPGHPGSSNTAFQQRSAFGDDILGQLQRPF